MPKIVWTMTPPKLAEAVEDFYGDCEDAAERIANVVTGYYIHSADMGEIVFFKLKCGKYETVIANESVYTDKIDDIIKFCQERA